VPCQTAMREGELLHHGTSVTLAEAYHKRTITPLRRAQPELRWPRARTLERCRPLSR
jgi:hypothetical protein